MALVGNEVLQVTGLDNKGQLAATTQTTTTGSIAALATAQGSASTFITPLNTVGGTTIPAAAIGGRYIARGGVQVAAFTDTTDTAANIISTFGANATIGQAYAFTLDNLTSQYQTLQGGTGVTVSGATIIPPNSYNRYLLTYSAANTITIVAVEGGMIQSTVSGAQYTANAATAATTLTAVSLGGTSDVTIDMTGTLAAGATLTLPTVAALVAAIPNAQIGFSYNVRILNHSSGAFAWTVTTNTGWTLVGTMSIAQTTYRDFVVTLNSLTAATLTQIGTGTAG